MLPDHWDISTQTIAVVTGATGAIGKAIVKGIAGVSDHAVILLCRNEQKAKKAVAEIIQSTGNDCVKYELVDVSCRESIFSLAAKWDAPLHILVNNAAVTPRQRMETPEGIEMQFATNVMGYFWMIKAFTPKLIQSAPSRVINVASYWAGELELDDLQFIKRPYRNGIVYRQSKQADRMLTVAFAERLISHKVSVNACHPGDVNSQLSNDLGFGGHQSPQQGAETPLWLATRPIENETTGKYFEEKMEVHDHYASRKHKVEALYQFCDGIK
ncbi:MAG: SDR family NAD(P)-dependent oxidoreductase [Anaerolineaceae bacterium]|nr:SDR family NAD(P)-dependent oxidoreductase [Anaerolineaceae bacterium]